VVDVPYERLFRDIEMISVSGHGDFAAYGNRNSLDYLHLYPVPEIKTLERATLRHPAFCKGWAALVSLDMTSEDDDISNSTTLQEWTAFKADYSDSTTSLKDHIAAKLSLSNSDEVLGMLESIGLFSDRPTNPTKTSSSAQLLDLLNQHWAMKPADRDMIVMQHEIDYRRRGEDVRMTSYMVLKGESRDYSAMAKTVGLPMAILCRLILKNKVVPPIGIHIPTMASVYQPVLAELKNHGIIFHEHLR
jgi:saccharopine dehydrogenase-like NADP-dependent oxidoreductase